MSELSTEGAAGAAEQQPIAEITVEGEGKLSLTEAARALAGARKPKEQQEAGEQRAESAAQPAARESADEAEAAPPETEVRGETEEGADPANLPPIEPPRSWTKEDKELFTSLPRETQERIAERERSRESDFLRRQNEAADKLKGLTAKEQAVEQARQQYEAALPILLENLQGAMAGEFADIKTMADVQKMASEDWPRYIRWDAQQKQIAVVKQELSAPRRASNRNGRKNSRNSPGVRTICSRRRSPTWRTPRRRPSCRPPASPRSRAWGLPTRNWRNRGTARRISPFATTACSS